MGKETLFSTIPCLWFPDGSTITTSPGIVTSDTPIRGSSQRMLKWEITGTVVCAGRISTLDLFPDTQDILYLPILSVLSLVSGLINGLFWGGDYPDKPFDLNHHGNSFLLPMPLVMPKDQWKAPDPIQAIKHHSKWDLLLLDYLKIW